jgi:serine/threonine-protein phosphatase 2A regulatory subunit A
VRDAASSSAQAIADILPQETFQDQYAAMLAKLATKEWFTARISAASLLANAYSKLTEKQQEEHLNHFAQLCRDDTPMVRRVAAQYLGKMLENVVKVSGRAAFEKDGIVSTLFIPLYEELASNEQPVRFAQC